MPRVAAPLLSVDDARRAVLAELSAHPAAPVPLADALGLCLSEPAAAAADSPPFAKATMDGYAVRAADCAAVPVELEVVEEVPAGSVPARPVGPGQCSKIMTGAPLPAGADAVVPVEVSERDGPDGRRVRLSPNSGPRPGAAVMARGAAVRAGQTVAEAGVPLTPAAIGVLAEHGFDPATCVPRLRVAVLSTGDEVVPASQTPGPGQIRDANGPLLAAAVRAAGAVPVPLGPVGDDEAALTAAVRRGLGCDAVIVSGGVSAGDFDLVPAALAACGVRAVFHGVNVKPGKPLWFGLHDGDGERGETGPVPVFGLPGNPVSSLTGFELFVRPALRRLMGFADAEPVTRPATLSAPVANRGDRPLWRPVRLTETADGPVADPVPWAGSGDLAGAAAANGAALVPGNANLDAGATVAAAAWAGCGG